MHPRLFHEDDAAVGGVAGYHGEKAEKENETDGGHGTGVKINSGEPIVREKKDPACIEELKEEDFSNVTGEGAYD